MTTSTIKFGKLLQAFRKRERLSQLKLALYLGVDDSTINRIEAGTRKPPRNPDFYQKLREVPGFTDNDIALLMSTEDSPPWLAEIRHRTTPAPISSQPRQVIKARYRVTVTVEVDPTGLSEEEAKPLKEKVDYLGGLVEKDAEWLLEDFISHEAKRLKLVSGNSK
jgi:transcriptional regulator with XRE-family HTH domain